MAAAFGKYSNAVPITPDDTVNFDQGVCDAIHVGTKGATGTVVAVLQNGAAISFVGLPASTILPIRAIRVNVTTTDASDLLALYQV